MKHTLIFISFFLLITSCSFNGISSSYVHFIEIDGFEKNDENITIAKDLLTYPFFPLLKKSFPSLNQNDLKQIRVAYFIPTSENAVKFKVTIKTKNDNIKSLQDEICGMFDEKIKNLVQLHINKALDLLEAKETAEQWYQLIDDEKYDLAYNEAHIFFKNKYSSEYFTAGAIKDRKNAGDLKSRIVGGKYYFRDEPFFKYYNGEKGAPEGDFVVFMFFSEFTKHKNGRELIVLWKSTEKKWVVTGFQYKALNVS